jgi:glycosyltransferase involved in cell wall biosynthesis
MENGVLVRKVWYNMRILFYVIGNSHRSNYLTGDNIRYGGGSASGTDTSSILVAEYLAKIGHDVVFACEKTLIGETSRGVKYTNLNLDQIENKEFDILVSMLWVDDYNTIPAKITKSVIYWSHMQWIYGFDNLTKYTEENNLKLGVVHISNWEKFHTEETYINYPNKNNILTTLIPNPVADDIIEKVHSLPIKRRPHKFIFHPAWARGGGIAYDVVNQLPWKDKELHTFSYLMDIDINWGRETSIEPDSFLKIHGGVDKLTLFSHLMESEYFVYPLYTPYQDVHKDTFSCVIAEAIAMGCIVLTYPLGAVPEYFGDKCVWLDLPDGFSVEDMQNESLSKDFDGAFKNTDNIIQKINYLENNPELKQEIRSGSKEYIVSNFSVNKIGVMWQEFIERL